MKNAKILWVDDEIDLLKIQILFLEEKGYFVRTANNAEDAIELLKEQVFDLIFLDENMPGMSGLEAIGRMKSLHPEIPIVMVTKSEAEDIMDQAIGSKIADYLIKPVNPNQVLLAIKKNVDNKRLISEKTTADYQTEFSKLGMQINLTRTFDEWVDVYKKLIYWELELDKTNNNAMDEVLKLQKNEANNAFTKFIKTNYPTWFGTCKDKKPLTSQEIFKIKVFPLLDKGDKVFFILIDNLRYDQYKIIQPLILEHLQLEEDMIYCGILPTATQYARNAMFAGLMPDQIAQMYPKFWLNDEEEGGKNEFEQELLHTLFERYRKKIDFKFEKIFNNKAGKRIVENLNNYMSAQLTVVVYNFVDILSHARTDMQMIRELANDESAYRSLTKTWFEHSPLFELLKELSNHKVKIIITTDHGTVRVESPIKVIGDKNTSTNLRYKQGKNLNYNPKEVMDAIQPQQIGLPITNISSTYIFATNKDFFAYPNNYNHYVKYYKETFQHGGISMEEMLIPIITLKPKTK